MGDWHQEKSCGTTHCIAGWAQVLSGRKQDYDGAYADGQEVLGLTEEQAERLFYITSGAYGDWPEQFKGEGEGKKWSPTPQQAVDRIEHFILTEGRE